MSTYALVQLSEMGGEKYLFLAPASFVSWAESLPHQFSLAPKGPKGRPSSLNISAPANIVADFTPLLQSSLQPMQITVGSAENDAYIYAMKHVKVFDSYGDVFEYAINNGWAIDEKNGFDGVFY